MNGKLKPSQIVAAFVVINGLYAVLGKVKVVKIEAVKDYKIKLIDLLDKGNQVESFQGVKIDESLVLEEFCDFHTEFHPIDKKGWGYIPSICVTTDDCTAAVTVGEFLEKTCKAYGDAKQSQAKYVCCPTNATKAYIKRKYTEALDYTDVSQRLYEFSEVLSDFKMFAGYNYTILTGRNMDYVDNELIIEASMDANYIEKVQKELVCGFKRGAKLKSNVQTPKDLLDIYERIPFFCVHPGKCMDVDDVAKTPHPGWDQFCQNIVKPRTEHEGKTKCCHPSQINKDVFEYVKLPQLPLFLKYAPGLRSAFKCEEYSRHVCSGPYNHCEEVDTSNPTKQYEDPNMALLGFVVPKLLLFHCGGTLISVRYVLSSESCQSYFGYTTNIVLLGEYNISNADITKVERTYLISKVLPYQRSGFKLKEGEIPRTPFERVDLALYRTDTDVQLSHGIRPVCLYHHSFTWPNKLNFIGFGTSLTGSERTVVLKTIQMPLMSKSNCLESTSFFEDQDTYYARFGVKNDWLMCYGDIYSAYNAPCKYDTGGPLQVVLDQPYCSQQVLGILSSMRIDCSQTQPTVFTNVSQFIAEIEDQVWGDYMFMDIFDYELQKPKCGFFKNLYFFNECLEGEIPCTA